jgi:hypothetical protein
MYSLTDKQIDFILDDIRARGVETEDLQLNLLDHICCIIESELEENGNFEQFYQRTISSFYKKELKELEDETQLLLTFKNYYAMKKTMIVSGFISAILLLAGGFFKVMHWPGANVGLILGIGFFSLLFLPLMFTLRLREKKDRRDKVVLILGLFVSVMLLVGALFKIMHWPGAGIFVRTGLPILLFIYLPIYIFNGMRNPDTKVNTIITSILIIAGSGFLMVLPARSQSIKLSKAAVNYLKNEEAALVDLRTIVKPDSSSAETYSVFMRSADKLKDAIIKGISGVDFNTYLADDENIQPEWLTPDQLMNFPETHEFINSLVAFETKMNASLYKYEPVLGNDSPEREVQMNYLLSLQPHVVDLICFISNTQTKASLVIAKKSGFAAN